MASPPRFDASSVRAFLARDWAAFERAGDLHWAAQRRQGGALAMFRITEMLRAQAQTNDAAWPRETDREADLETHRRVSKILSRTAKAHAGDDAPRRPPRGVRGGG